jgi:hypothetical protein
MGVTLADQPSLAAEYYARAREAAGDDPAEAAGLLGSVCERLSGETDTNSTLAFQTYCPQ